MVNLLAATNLLLATLTGLVCLRIIGRPAATRMPLDPYRPRRFGKTQLEARAQGDGVLLGTDRNTNQPYAIPHAMRCQNVLVLGPVGSGKSSLLTSSFLGQDIARGPAHNCVVVFDAQEDLTPQVIRLCERAGRSYCIFPDVSFNPLNQASSPFARAAAFATVFTQVAGVEPGNPAFHWIDLQTQFVRKIIPLFERAYNQPMILAELYELALSAQRREELLNDAGVCPEADEYRLCFGGWKEQQFEERLSGLVSFLERLLSEERKWLFNQRFAPTLAQAIEKRHVIIIREGGFAGTPEHTAGLLFSVALQEYILKRPIPQEEGAEEAFLISVYQDESYLFYTADFPKFISLSRKKRAALHLAFQSFNHLGRYRDVIVGNCKTWVVLGGLVYDDAELIARNIGRRLFRQVVQSRSLSIGAVGSESEAFVYDHLWSPERIRALANYRELLVLPVEDGVAVPYRHLAWPRLLRPKVRPYDAPKVSAYAPPTIWQERDEGNAREVAGGQDAADEAAARGQADEQAQTE